MPVSPLHPAPSASTSAGRSVLFPLLGLLAAFVLHRFIAPILNPLHANLALDIGVNVILAVSLTIVNGYTGQFSIGHAGFMAIGAYTAASTTYYGSILLFNTDAFLGGSLSASQGMEVTALFTTGDLLFLSGCLMGGLIAAVAGLLVGLPSLRLRGDYLAIVTLGFGEIMRVLLEQSPEQILNAEKVREVGFPSVVPHLGGAIGFGRVPFYASLFWVYAFVTLTIVVAYRIKKSSHGRALLSIRENEVAAGAMGIPITRYKVTAFVIAACLAGFAGGLVAHQVRLIPAEFGFQKSFDILIMVVLGGLGSISGSVIAAAIVTLLPELLRDPPHIWPVMLIVIAFVLFLRKKQGVRATIILVIITVAWEIVRATVGDLSSYRMILFALALILMMILRPQGLLGIQEIWDLWRRKENPPSGAKP